MKKEGSILIVDDNKSILTALQILLSSYFERIILHTTPNRIKTTLREEKIDLVLLDMNFSAGINNGNEGLFWLSEIKNTHPDIPVILITAYADIELAIEGMKRGATDFIVKPWNNLSLISTLLAPLKKGNKKTTTNEEVNPNNMFWGTSEKMKEIRSIVEKVSVTDANILITGENGTGKEMLAREIHRLSYRNNEPLVCVDLGAIAENLFESELFGHVKGSFTDAKKDRMGKFELANKGTLFLDEIGNVPFHLQSKLLTAIQNRYIIRIGSNTPIETDIRLICATNCHLQERVNEKLFREDLLYRINTIHIEIPSLRQRPEDIVPLANLFLKRYGEKYKKPLLELSENAAKQITGYPWYGNIRELQHAIEKAVILSENNTLENLDLQLSPEPEKREISDMNYTLEEMEREMIKSAIAKYEGNLSAVATQLGITRQTLYNKMRKFGL
ncbi:MAG TPA: sigma-54-dependent Fis family transcriptional regulator [Candidatus Gallibacteroides avistercoris]|uniref:Sigma-54-dependent Fis family transcriptional regulator n=1 Tax=Candidatus Gallibacteroides avistercoris TaxID=2840833 RepID=A0A9D1M660_9BACT|nr:sigma-54-dependent Fis family transcriptional regulator [Candidatus Gallibacteroides avistercoris]